MGFWNDLLDATPAKSHARANELHQCGINGCIDIPSVMIDKVYDCSICKVRFGQTFAKNSVPFLITSDFVPSFSPSNTGVVVCHKCVGHFGFYQTSSKTEVPPNQIKSEQNIHTAKAKNNFDSPSHSKKEVEDGAISKQIAPKPKTNIMKNNEKEQQLAESRKIVCSQCRSENSVTERQIKRKEIYHPLCNVCRGELPV